MVSSKIKKFLSLVPLEDTAGDYSKDILEESFFGFPMEPLLRAEERLFDRSQRSVAYFSMEYGLSCNTYQPFGSVKPISDSNFSAEHHIFSNMRAMDYYLSVDAGHRLDLPIYSGGLGVLAGDTLKSAADRGVPLVASGILWNKGYFKQNFWFKNGQIPEETNWDPRSFPGLIPLTERIEVRIQRETIHLRLWKYFVYGFDKKNVIPLILLDSNLPENSVFTQKLTEQLYKSDNAEWRLLQRVVLGIGGIRALDKLGYAVDTYHLNEGHAALAFVEKTKGRPEDEIQELKKHFNYTCHTPVAAGHDRFQKKLVQDLLLEEDASLIKKYGNDPHYGDLVNLTELAMNTC
jgi:starch phosphorylase